MAITRGFGMSIDLASGAVRKWVMGGDGVRRWDDGEEDTMRTIYNTGKNRWMHDQPIYENGRIVRNLLGPCPKCGSITSTYGGSYSCHNYCCQHSAANPAYTTRIKPAWWNTDVRVFLYGGSWCAVGTGFENLQEIPAGFGDSPTEAVAALTKERAK